MINDLRPRPTDARTSDERDRYNEFIERNLELSNENFYVVYNNGFLFENGAWIDRHPLGMITEARTDRTDEEKAENLELFYRLALKFANHDYGEQRRAVISQCSSGSPSPEPETIRTQLKPSKGFKDAILIKWGEAKTALDSFADAGLRNEAKIAAAMEANRQRALKVIETEFGN